MSHYQLVHGAAQSLQSHRWVLFPVGSYTATENRNLPSGNLKSEVSLNHQLFFLFEMEMEDLKLPHLAAI